MAPVVSRYRERLEREILQAGEGLAGDELRAELAAYAARHGEFANVANLVAELRQRAANRTSARLVAWLNMAEGFREYYSSLTTSARDKFARAQAVTEFAGAKTLTALSSAWLAHLDYMALNPEALVKNVRRAFDNSSDDDHHVRSRASLVMAEALHFARRFELARPWYDRARVHANLDGDQPTLSAYMFNMTWLRMGDARQSELCGEPVSERLGLIRIDGESAQTYEMLIGSVTFRELDPMLIAEVSSLDGKPAEALDLYERHLGDLRLKGADRWKCVFAADQAWCLARLGRLEEARVSAALAEELVSGDVQVDDRAATYSWLQRTYEALGDLHRASASASFATAMWEETRQLQARFVTLLSEVPIQ